MHRRAAEGGDGVNPAGETVILVVAVLGGLFALAPGGDQSAEGVTDVGGGFAIYACFAVVDAVQSAVACVGVHRPGDRAVV